MEEEQQKRNQGGSIMENTMWRVLGLLEIIKKKSWPRNCGGGALNEIPWRRNQGRDHGGETVEKAWMRDHGGEIITGKP